MTKLMVIAAIATGAAVFAPRSMAAQSCTDGYQSCLNDTYETSGATRFLADVECFAAYIGCVRKSL